MEGEVQGNDLEGYTDSLREILDKGFSLKLEKNQNIKNGI